jgi:orotate phosphoribosyltransferase
MSELLENANKLAAYLLQIKAIQINLQNPYTWTSGWRSPIYCDNRKVLSYPEIRTFVKKSLAGLSKNFEGYNVIAGVATAGIPYGALLADELNLPFVYVRSQAKGHGLQNKIEGQLPDNPKVLVVEDTLSTGKSSIEAIEALEAADCKIIGLVALYSYNFPQMADSMKAKNIHFESITNYDNLLSTAIDNNLILKDELETLNLWRSNPKDWQPK